MPLFSIKSPWNRYGLEVVGHKEQTKIEKEAHHEIGVVNKITA